MVEWIIKFAIFFAVLALFIAGWFGSIYMLIAIAWEAFSSFVGM